MTDNDLAYHEVNAKKPEKKKKEEKKTPSGILHIYDRHYKKLLIIPLLLIIFSFGVVLVNYASTGELFHRDISLKGGVSITVYPDEQVNIQGLEEHISHFSSDILVRETASRGKQQAVVVDAGIEIEEADALIDEIKAYTKVSDDENVAVQAIGSSLGNSFLRQALGAIVMAFAFMAVVIFLYFRNFLPAAFVIWTVFVDMVGTLAIMILIDQPISSAGLAAFLMLIGYSVDTDILLTSRVLKGKEETIFERVTGALKTGLTLTATALAAIGIGYIMGTEGTLKEIMLVLLIGLSIDVVHTWLTNASLLRWYMEKKYVH